jgi:peroxiredoxin
MPHTHATTRPHEHATSEPETPVEAMGWHCGHYYYCFDRQVIQRIDRATLGDAAEQFEATLNPSREAAPKQMQSYIISGHKADFGVMVLDENPLAVDGVHQQLMASPLGPAIIPTYSFVSLTEVSEYLPTTEQYAQRLLDDGMDADSEQTRARVKAYADREPQMRRERLAPELPDWPATCFYPMNKKRKVGENWFTLDFDERYRMMAEHGRSGMKFAGKVTQLITVSLGLDDWEWGVTLWARNPEFLKEIVYKMRFDEASARFAEFGPFYTSYVSSPEAILDHCKIRS